MGVHLAPHPPLIAGLDVHHSSSRRSSGGGRSSAGGARRSSAGGAQRSSTGGARRSLNGAMPTAVQPAAAAVDASAEPIIVTFSWLGANKRPMSKYTELWRSLGYSHVISARSKVSSIMVPPAGHRRVAKFTRKLILAAQHRPDAPILVHLFSHGGFMYMAAVLKKLAKLAPRNAAAADVHARIAGIILDSSPASVTADVFSRAIVAAALARPADGIEAAMPRLVNSTTAVLQSYLDMPSIRSQVIGFEQAWLQHAPPCPKLFLYSDADVLVEPVNVERFMEEMTAAGSPTFCHKWGDSEHVCHYRKYPEEYTRQLVQFVQLALTGRQVQAAEQQQQEVEQQQQEQQQHVQMGGVGVAVCV